MQQSKNIPYKIIPFFAALYFTISIFTTFLTDKLMITPLGILPAAAFLSPFWFLLGDVIAEIYDYKMSMRLFWSSMICEFLFTSICYFLVNTPFPDYWQWAVTYHDIFKYVLIKHLWETLAIIIAWQLNAYLITKWRTITQGKYFWLRSLGSSTIGETLFSLLMLPSWLVLERNVHLKEAIMLFLWMISLRASFIAIFAFPASVIVKLLKIVENKAIPKDNFNPFHKLASLFKNT